MCKCDICDNEVRDLVSTDDGMACEACLVDYEECADCGMLVKFYTEINGRVVCSSCAEEYEECSCCGGLFSSDEMNDTYEDGRVCDSCLNSEYTECEDCGRVFKADELEQTGNGDYVCSSCLNYNYFQCSHCDEYYHVNYRVSDDNMEICEGCYDDHYVRCDDCENLIETEEAHRVVSSGNTYYYCDYCYDNNERYYDDDGCAINDYDYEPDFEMFGTPARPYQYFGLEIELDKGGKHSDNAETLMGILGSDFTYAMSDGSLSNGFEIATMPASYAHLMGVDWESFKRTAVSLGYRAHDTSTCGLHIHIDRRAFGSDYDKRDLGIMKFLFLVERCWEQMVKFSRRTSNNLDQWAQSYRRGYGDPDDPEKLYDYAKRDLSKYRSVNLCHSNTVEVRIFRGTLNPTTLRATIQLIKILNDIACEFEVAEVSCMTWEDIVKYGSEYAEFMEYCASRALLPAPQPEPQEEADTMTASEALSKSEKILNALAI